MGCWRIELAGFADDVASLYPHSATNCFRAIQDRVLAEATIMNFMQTAGRQAFALYLRKILSCPLTFQLVSVAPK